MIGISFCLIVVRVRGHVNERSGTKSVTMTDFQFATRNSAVNHISSPSTKTVYDVNSKVPDEEIKEIPNTLV